MKRIYKAETILLTDENPISAWISHQRIARAMNYICMEYKAKHVFPIITQLREEITSMTLASGGV